MTRVLLTGAGFTRNWGGWLASEFIGVLCGRLIDRPHLNEALRASQNFEQVLGECRVAVTRDPDNAQAREDLLQLERAILASFRDMNEALVGVNFNFSQEARCTTRRFLSRFDAIFTLNQDLLFELHYDGMYLESDGRRRAHYFPGVKMTHEYLNPRFARDRLEIELEVASSCPPVEDRKIQPIYKLHGSVNFRRADGNRVLVMGTGKEAAIDGNDLLRSYQAVFREHLFRGNTRIMVLGYGFADPYVNDLLHEAAIHRGLAMYLVNTSGIGCFAADPRARADGKSQLLDIPLVGLSTRKLSEILANSDDPEFKNFERFLLP